MAGLALRKLEDTKDLPDQCASEVPQWPPLGFDTSVLPNGKKPSDVSHRLLMQMHFPTMTEPEHF